MTLLLVHAGATVAMAGLIWFVQLVHYPLFELASRDRFAAFAEAHQRRTAWVVMPLMVTEAVTVAALLVRPPMGLGRDLLWAGAALLALIWLSTALLQVPEHRRLGAGWDATSARRLVRGNWLRTVGWSVRAWLALELVARASG